MDPPLIILKHFGSMLPISPGGEIILCCFITGFTLLSGLAGLSIGAPVLIALSAVFFSLLSHTLLVSHEGNRWQGAKVLAKESIALNDSLKKTQGFFKEATTGLMSVTHLNSRKIVTRFSEEVQYLTGLKFHAELL